ncbi:hypothetical protein BASA50_001168 [Batrachochytrium salamandrivorans]|uniref:Cytochrome b561 domain-containing protein n=1 Tax=Batrachochytrium salamandrivorans TaxID=1357716 RepID=A0ABQ8EUR7_9FUNG|nr:hypothetical protein BASA60_008840 [Batrachochytrium salamandrivorans]KAH6578071.1 hypothetical protein BASA62_000511 [Batrachochytrium salamandrivorans]KAH6579155.1 hypothetical protein BASA61_010457 [Batrachochytrium salamandrivorans]KAH6585559.1 hypothetical protein BASA50_001168 [Batrachochytrium salamandrivorans]KAH9248853.1 hypothetical protein BASA81_013463 [Batrachochytrium salamandrivorans]
MHTSSRPFSLYRLGLSALATLAFLAGPAVALSKNCPVPNSFCIYSFNDEQGNAVFTIHSSATGWAAIGTGTAMAASSMVVGWANGTGGYTISNRLSTAHAMPTVAATQFATLMPLQVPAPQWATLAFSFRWDSTSSIATLASPGNYIYAFCAIPPTANGAIARHDNFGAMLSFDYISAAPSGNGTNTTSVSGSGVTFAPILTSTPSMYKTIVVLHGVSMFIAWGVAPLIGIFIARYLKNKLDVWWYRLHLIIMFMFCFLLTIGSTAAIVLYKSSPHFQGLHRLLGIVVSVAVVFQVIMGFVSNAMFTPGRDRIPVIDKIHWWFGRILCVAGVVNIFFGLILFQDMGYPMVFWLPVLLGVYFFVVFVLFSMGERYFGQVNHGKLVGLDELRKSFHGSAPHATRRMSSSRDGHVDGRTTQGGPSVPQRSFEDMANDRYSKYTDARFSVAGAGYGNDLRDDRSYNRRDDNQIEQRGMSSYNGGNTYRR